MKQVGNVELPQDAFFSNLKVIINGELFCNVSVYRLPLFTGVNLGNDAPCYLHQKTKQIGARRTKSYYKVITVFTK